jgi:hypothetical protein
VTTNLFLYDGEMPADIAHQLERKSKREIDRVLASGLEFTARDLAANRKGVMTEGQKNVLRHVHRESVSDYRPIVYILGAMFGCFFTAVFAFGFDYESIVDLICGAIFFGLGTLLVGVDLIRRWSPVKQDLAEGSIRSASGVVVLLPVQPQAKIGKLAIGGEIFKLDMDGYLRFKHLDTYTIYYAPRSKVILSAEPMTE